MNRGLGEPAGESSHGAADFRSLEQAAEWYALLGSAEATEADQSRWRDWLRHSRAHRAAWGYVEQVGERFRRLRESAGSDAAGAALASAAASRTSRRRALKGLGLLALAAPLAWAAGAHTPLRRVALAWGADHRTETGEIRQVGLPCGSRLWLASASAVRLAYGPRRRRLELVAGEILVETVADPRGRPLAVSTAEGQLRALGTRFSVRRGPGTDSVAVFDGAVEVRPAGGGARRVIRAGRQASFSAAAVAPSREVEPARDAWHRGVLVADQMPLGELAAELGRYRLGHLGVAPELADLPVMGVYPLDDTDRALELLAAALPLRLHRPLPWWVTLVPRR